MGWWRVEPPVGRPEKIENNALAGSNSICCNDTINGDDAKPPSGMANMNSRLFTMPFATLPLWSSLFHYFTRGHFVCIKPEETAVAAETLSSRENFPVPIG